MGRFGMLWNELLDELSMVAVDDHVAGEQQQVGGVPTSIAEILLYKRGIKCSAIRSGPISTFLFR